MLPFLDLTLSTLNLIHQSDWEASSEEEEEEEKPKPVPVAPPKKKGTLKAKLAEKEAEKKAKAAAGDLDYDEDAVLDPREKARIDKERELAADLNNAADLFGAAALGGESFSPSLELITAFPLSRHPIRGSRLASVYRCRHLLEGARLAHLRSAAHEGRLCRVLRQDH